MCASLSIYADPRLHSLCMRKMPEINFISDENLLEKVKFDYHLPLGSVPGLIRNDMRDFDRTVTGYLKADPRTCGIDTQGITIRLQDCHWYLMEEF